MVTCGRNPMYGIGAFDTGWSVQFHRPDLVVLKQEISVESELNVSLDRISIKTYDADDMTEG